MIATGEHDDDRLRDWLKALEDSAPVAEPTNAKAAPRSRTDGAPGYWTGTGSWLAGPYFTDRDRSRRAPSPQEIVEAYKSIVYTCTRINFNALSRVPLRLYATTTGSQHRPKIATGAIGKRAAHRIKSIGALAEYTKGAQAIEEVTEHPLLDAVTKVNPQWNLVSLIRYTSACLDLLGRSHWWMEAGPGSPLGFVWPLLPQYMLPVRSGDRALIDYFNYGQMQLAYDEVVEVREVAMRDPYALGVSPAEASFAHSDLFDSFISYQRNTFEQGARPSMLVSNKDAAEPLGKAERERFQRDINASLVRASQGVAWVVDGAIDVKTLSFPPADLASLEISDNALQRVANAFGVPLSLLKTEDVNLANAEAGHRQHAELTIDPRCSLIAACLTKWTRARGKTIERALKARGVETSLGWDRLLWCFDSPVPEDDERRAKVFDIYLKAGVHTINDVRLEMGYEPVPWGDEPWMPNTLVQPTTADEQRQIANQRADRVAEQPKPREGEATGKPKPGEPGDDDTEDDQGDEAKPPKPKRRGKRLKADRPAKDVPTPKALLNAARRRFGLGGSDVSRLTDAQRTELLKALRLVARLWLRGEARKTLAEIQDAEGIEPTDVSVLSPATKGNAAHAKRLGKKAKEIAGRFFERAGRFVRNALTAAALTVLGPGATTLAEVEGVRQAQAEQMDFLARFADELLDGQQPLDGTFVSRAESYGASVWSTGQGAKAAASKLAFERAVHLSFDLPCHGCRDRMAQGWQPRGTLVPIGDVECRSGCHCDLQFSDNPDNEPPPYPAGDPRNIGFFTPSPKAKRRYKTVLIDVAKLDQGWQKDGQFYIAPGAESVRGRRAEFQRFLAQAKAEGIPIEQSMILVDENGEVIFEDGRHRFAELRDMGVKFLPVSVWRSEADRARRLYGWQG